MKKPLIAVLAILLLAAIAAGWRFSRHSGNSDSLVLYGNIDIRQVSLAFEGAGRIRSLHAEEGDSVPAGALLAVLDTETLVLQAAEAQAQIDAQQQRLRSLHNGSRPEEIAQARSRVSASEADVSLAKRDFRRLQDMAGSTQGRSVSEQELDHAKNRLTVAEARVTEQREALRLIEEGPREEDIAAAEAQLRVLQAKLALLQHQIEQGQLMAPAAAVVRSRLLEPGDMASPQRPVFALALTRPKWLRVYVSEVDLGRIAPGMAAEVFTDSHPEQPIDGVVGYISSVAEFTPKSVQTEALRTSLVYEVRVRVEDPQDVLRLGQPATVKLTLGDRQ